MRRSTVVLVLLFIVMAGAYYFLKNRQQAADSPDSADIADLAVTLEPATETSYLFPSENGSPDSIRLEARTGEVVELARDNQNAWTVNLPGPYFLQTVDCLLCVLAHERIIGDRLGRRKQR